MRYLICCLLAISLASAQKTHTLKATPETVVVGYYDAKQPPVLRIQSGDTVRIETLGVGTPEMLIATGLKAELIEPMRTAVVKANPGKRGHFLTGPIAIEGAEPGDMLEVQIRSIELAAPFSYNGMGNSGVLAKEFPEGKRRIIMLDAKRKVGLWGPGIEVPLRPFFGSMGVAPPLSMGRIPSGPPGIHAGNLDNKDLVAGTTLFIPVHVPGAWFQVGDGHAAQADGEVDQTGLETSLNGTFVFKVHKGKTLKWPRAETPTHYIAMGIDEDLNVATKLAVQEAVAFLASEKGMDPGDAYMLASVAVDLRITQLVDGTKGVHAMIPKSIFVNKR